MKLCVDRVAPEKMQALALFHTRSNLRHFTKGGKQMSYAEAIKDGIRTVRLKSGDQLYFPKCHKCGKEIQSIRYQSGLRYTCKECKMDNYLSDKEKKVTADKETKDKKFDNAVNRIKQHVRNIKKYDEAIKTVKANLYKDHWFDSTEEIMVAIELLHKRVNLRHQVRMGRYRVDFMLPDYKIILEVDGVMFHNENTRKKEQLRDNLIILNLGVEWEVIRITDKHINEDITSLLPALLKIKEKRKYYRKCNNGLLPKWYSYREL